MTANGDPFAGLDSRLSDFPEAVEKMGTHYAVFDQQKVVDSYDGSHGPKKRKRRTIASTTGRL